MLIWIQSPHEDNLSSCERYKIITSKALGTMHAQHFLITEWEQSIYDSSHFDIGCFRAEPTNYEWCLHPSDTFAYRSTHNNLFLRLTHNPQVKKVCRYIQTTFFFPFVLFCFLFALFFLQTFHYIMTKEVDEEAFFSSKYSLFQQPELFF